MIDPTTIDQATWRLAERLRATGLRLATAESCTGGWIAKAMTDQAGSSAWFDRGFVSYSNAAKEALLGVQSATIAAHGAVSEPVVCEMALGALARSEAEVAIAVSGIAGPTGGTAGKPVGTVCFGVALACPGAAATVESRTQWFAGDRDAVRHQSVIFGLTMASACLAAARSGARSGTRSGTSSGAQAGAAGGADNGR